MQKRIVHVVGARPNFVKVAPVHRALQTRAGVESYIVHTGQHYDRAMSDVFFEDLDIPEPDAYLAVGSGTHAEQTAAVMLGFESFVNAERPDLVAVYGDVNSTMACALVAAKLGIPVAHVEAGLRSNDKSMPEEVNRIITDHISDLMLVTEPSGRRNLEREGIPAFRIVDTGNVMIDSLVKILRQEGITHRKTTPDRPLILATLHRPSNVDVPARLDTVIRLLLDLSKDHRVVFPVHPRTRKRIEQSELGATLQRQVTITEPLGYREFVVLLASASLIISDSGGIQEESAYIGVPCLTLRTSTERPITIEAGTNVLESTCADDLTTVALNLMKVEFPAIGENDLLCSSLWDGCAGERVADALIKHVGLCAEPQLAKVQAD